MTDAAVARSADFDVGTNVLGLDTAMCAEQGVGSPEAVPATLAGVPPLPEVMPPVDERTDTVMAVPYPVLVSASFYS